MKKFAITGLLMLSGSVLCSGQTARERPCRDWIIMDMVHHNPGEPFTESVFNDPGKLAGYGFNAQVINEFQSVHTAITYDSLDPDIFPAGSPERFWVDSLAQRITRKIRDIHAAGLEAYYFTDIIVFPQRLVEKYRDEICSADGKIDFLRPKTQEIHRLMLREVFERFPELDGLVIRFGETYLHNTPYHTGNGPVPRRLREQAKHLPYKSDGGEQIHRELMNLLREEVCVKQKKKIFYRTWDTGYFHTVPGYYLAVTDGVTPHADFYICVKHVEGDYHRTYNFNPTLGIGQHRQIVEVQCQREYEGKGAYPNYIAEGVIDGFEEMKAGSGIYSLNQLKQTPQMAGIWTWSRGGGWVGPYITNEFWCDVNAYVLSRWANDPAITERDIFRDYAWGAGFREADIDRFHRLARLSADAIVRGRASLLMPVNVWWTRDQFIGSDRELGATFRKIFEQGMTERMLAEKQESVAIWEQIVALADSIQTGKPKTLHYLRTSSRYGWLLFSIFEQGWIVMLKGYEGDQTGVYERERIRVAIAEYDRLWEEFHRLKADNDDCATLYQPYSFKFGLPPVYHDEDGLHKTIDRYRKI